MNGQTSTLPKGFYASGFSGKVKKSGKDMALIYSERPAAAAGVFTRNIVRADCVSRNESLITKGGTFRGILVNSGNANACTGAQGRKDSRTLAEGAAELLSERFAGSGPGGGGPGGGGAAEVKAEELLLASTGVIGVPLPVDRMMQSLSTPGIKPHADGLEDAAEAIMTTDTFPKIAAADFTIDGKSVRLSGIAKGSGMIHPDMATMLSFVLTDADIDRQTLAEALRQSANKSFNMISVDGDTSTNDMCIILANGASKAARIDSLETEAGSAFLAALEGLTRRLAVLIARDGEGATKLLEIRVRGAESEESARRIVRSVSSSTLVKTAFFGEDANWGRVLAAMGYSGASFDPEEVDIAFSSDFGDIALMKNGTPVLFDEKEAANILSAEDIYLDIQTGGGPAEAVGWGCDLSYDYVKINGDYRT